MKTLRWFLFNGFFCMVAYMWVVMKNEHAGLFLVVMAWIVAASSMFALQDQVIEERIKQGGFEIGVPLWVDFAYDCCFTLVFLYGGAPVAGVAYFVHSIIIQAHHRALKHKLAEAND